MTFRLAVTPGELAGIGPDLLIQAAQQGSQHPLIAYADPDALAARAKLLNLPLVLKEPENRAPLNPGELFIRPVTAPCPAAPGQLDPRNARYVLEALEAATSDCLAGSIDALVTGPVHKGVINEAGIPFTGHTEFLANLTNTPRVVMMLASDTLRVALVTTHLPLRKVPDAITPELLESVIRILDKDLRGHFGIAQPRILVAGLNPHAGEDGHLGREEIEVIRPVLDALNRTGMRLEGPLPADTLFTREHLQGCDAVLAMYHDQGLPVLKHAGFGKSVNITLGLPIIRTSVDHGTALDLAGTGKADTGSLLTAIRYAAFLAERKISR